MNIFYDQYGLNPLGISMLSIIFILLIVLGVFMLESTSCGKKASMMGLESNYTILTKCMVKIDNKWQPFNRYNTINLTK